MATLNDFALISFTFLLSPHTLIISASLLPAPLCNMTDSSANATVWDTKTQQFHGGQDWKFLNNFVEDFSVTTNLLGTPVKALNAARDAVRLEHSSMTCV
jgi:hypothetical protein